MKKLLIVFLFVLASSLFAQNNTRWVGYYDVTDGKAYYLAWDIKTGKSTQYYWNGNETKWSSMEINLPAAPLPGATGNIMFNVYYDVSDSKAYYIVWDTKGGKSIQYYWNGNDTKWAAMEINLPAAPVPGAKGDIMIHAYYDHSDKKAYYVVYDTFNGQSIQYYWNGNETKWSPMEINLPPNPIK